MSPGETGQMSSVATGQMSSVETRQVSAVETGQMSAAETGQMSSVARTNAFLASIHNVEGSEFSTAAISQSMFKTQKPQVPQYHNVQVSEISTVAISQCSSLRWAVWP